MAQAFKDNAVGLGLDVLSLGLSVVPGGGFARTAATFVGGTVVTATSTVLSAGSGQTTEALVILARKILRIAFSIWNSGQSFNPTLLAEPCAKP